MNSNELFVNNSELVSDYFSTYQINNMFQTTLLFTNNSLLFINYSLFFHYIFFYYYIFTDNLRSSQYSNVAKSSLGVAVNVSYLLLASYLGNYILTRS